MKLLRYLFSYIAILWLISCSNEETDSLQSFNLKDLHILEEIKLSDLGIDQINYIPLETNDQALIRYIKNVHCDDKSFVLSVDRKQILKFSSDGSFIETIGKRGKGPDEYLNIHGIDIDKRTGNIYVLSAWEDKFYIYSPKGNFIRSFSSPIQATDFRLNGNYILCYSTNSDGTVKNSFDVIDYNGINIKSFINKYPYKSPPNPIIFMNENIFYRFNNKLLTKEINSDTVFVFTNQGFAPKFVLDHGERLMPPKARENYDLKTIMEKFVTQWNLFEFGNIVYYEFSTKNQHYCFIGSLTGSINILSKTENGIINDIDGGPNIKLKNTVNGNTIVSWINPFELKNYVSSKAFKNSSPKDLSKKAELEKFANGLKEDDNPILLLLNKK
jgi:hypothetical protein